MPRGYPAEFRQRAVELGRLGVRPVSQIAAELVIAQSALHRWSARLTLTRRQSAFSVSRSRAESGAVGLDWQSTCLGGTALGAATPCFLGTEVAGWIGRG